MVEVLLIILIIINVNATVIRAGSPMELSTSVFLSAHPVSVATNT